MTIYIPKVIGAIVCASFLVTTTVVAANKEQTPWLVDQIEKHPEIIAAKEKMNAVFSSSEGKKQPLYNPELTTGYEREGSTNNFLIGINQTIDWWDKQGTRTQQANFNLTYASKIYDFSVQEKTAQALQALVNYQTAKKQAVIAKQQENQLDQLLALVTERQKAGDLGQVDAELTFLGLTKMLNLTAQTQVNLNRSEAKVRELLFDWSPELKILPIQGFKIYNEQISPMTQEQWLVEHPLVLAAKALWQSTKGDAHLALLEAKAEPTIGIETGKVDRDFLVGVTFSIPLNIRNNFSAQARAANQLAVSAESTYQAVIRKQKFMMQSSLVALHAYKKYYQRWLLLTQGRDKRSEDLLVKQWQSGDMSTTEYLLAMQQRAEGLNAGIELQSQFQLSQIEWLLQTGQINAVLPQLAK